VPAKRNRPGGVASSWRKLAAACELLEKRINFGFSGTPDQSLFGPPQAGAQFADAVAVSGDYLVVGAPLEDATGTDSGRAYVFSVSTGALLLTLNNPTPAGNDYFGNFVAASGDFIVVSAYGDNTGASDAGSAYVFSASTGALLQTLNNPAPQAGDAFGQVAIFGDYVLVGAWLDDAGATDVGSAYLFSASTGSLLRTISNPTPAANDYFGQSVSLSGDVVVVGADGDNTGASDTGSAYVFSASTGALLQTLNNPAPQAGDAFGLQVSVSGDYVLVGAWLDDAGATDGG